MTDAPTPGRSAVRVDAAGCTDAGPVRTVNEDHWVVDRGLGLYIVADGMGGHQAGEVASQLAVAEVVADIAASGDADFAWPLGCDPAMGAGANRVRHALLRANDAVFAAGAADPALMGMGTTVTVLLVAGDEAVIGSVGDSRAYLVREAETRLLTHDDTWLASVLGADGARDAAARAHPMRHVLTNVIGTRGGATPEIVVLAWQPGDVVVLATDGLHNVVDDRRIGAVTLGSSVSAAAQMLVEEAVARGTTDNVTVVVVRRP
jgi:PPM family protein phosphatase